MFEKQFGSHMVELLYVGVFFLVNDNKYVDVNCL
jgi:hypothetical protein